jgi:hypothetical protein
MKLDEDNFYNKIVELNNIYNFVVVWNYLSPKIRFSSS